MKITFTRLTLALSSAVLLSLSATAQAEVDADAAKALAKKNDCFKCHAIDKTKKGPSYQKIAKKFKGKEEEGMKEMLKNITTAPKVKLEDGSEEEHKIIDTKDQAQIDNLLHWILAQ
ncbi:MAG: cytochrome C [Azonexus sp.]|jgi:cytochrome c|nr:cytochrome C [Azonexus sp.]